MIVKIGMISGNGFSWRCYKKTKFPKIERQIPNKTGSGKKGA